MRRCRVGLGTGLQRWDNQKHILNMKLKLKHLGIRSTSALDKWVEGQILSLREALRIDDARVQLVHEPANSPSYRVHVHLVTPGPDVFAAGNDHTLRAAFSKVMVELKDKIASRSAKRVQRIRSQLSVPTYRSRSCRAAH